MPDKKKVNQMILFVNIILIVIFTLLFTALLNNQYTEKKEYILNNSYYETKIITIEEEYNVTHNFSRYVYYNEIVNYTKELVRYEKEWFSLQGEKIKEPMISKMPAGYWSGPVGVCFVSLKVYNPNFVAINFSVDFIGSQIDTKQEKIRDVLLRIDGRLEPKEERIFSDIIIAGEFEDNQGELINWTFGTCDFKKLEEIKLYETDEVYYNLLEIPYNVTSQKNITKSRELTEKELAEIPKYITKVRNVSQEKEVLIPHYEKSVHTDIDFGSFAYCLIISFGFSLVLVFLLNFMIKALEKHSKKRRENRSYIEIKGAKIEFKDKNKKQKIKNNKK